MADGERVAYIGLGSNIDPEVNLVRAVEALRQRTRLRAVSSVWLSPSAGSSGPDFLNAAVCIETDLSAEKLKSKVLKQIEDDLGRVRSPDKNAPRTIDLDILIFDNEEIGVEIWRLPHVTVPLSEIYPSFRHPVNGKSLEQAASLLRSEISRHPLMFSN